MLRNFHIKRQRAFTLIELSIILVVIGLIIGGILVGRELIKAAEIRAQIKQIEEFKIATMTFKTKYNSLPGDIHPSEATQLGFFYFIGTYAGSSYLEFTSNPNGHYVYAFGNNDGTVNIHEQLVYWQHLSQAKLIPGVYGSTPATNPLDWDTSVTPSLNYGAGFPAVSSYPSWGMEEFIPRAKLATLLTEFYAPYVVVEPNHLLKEYKHYPTSNSNNFYAIGATPLEAFAIDTKIDDGKSNGGKIRDRCSSLYAAVYSPTGTCYNYSYSNLQGDYTINDPNIQNISGIIDWLW